MRGKAVLNGPRQSREVEKPRYSKKRKLGALAVSRVRHRSHVGKFPVFEISAEGTNPSFLKVKLTPV